MEHTKSNPKELDHAYDYSFSIVELNKLLLELESECLDAEIQNSKTAYINVSIKTKEMEFYLNKLSIWAKDKYIEAIK